MTNIVSMTSDQKQKLFTRAALTTGMSPIVIEKDYWVVWALWRLFEQKDLRPYLTFKGGTSLSKIYNVIKRFSEDIDISIEKGFFGFGGENAPEHASSRKKRSVVLENLSTACSKYIKTDLLELLIRDFEKHLGNRQGWNLRIDTADPDQQTILFDYPTTDQSNTGYIRRYVKMEMGARSEHWPVSEKKIRSYVKTQFRDAVEEPEITIRVLDIERTFWEKLTILHAYTHLPDDKKLPSRHARHYYDTYCLLKSGVKEKAATDLDLLARVAQHKMTYFASTWSHFETAVKGTLRLVPQQHLSASLKSDYTAMSTMFFEDPPAWNTIIETIAQFEKEFNGQ
ncbi:MAG: nucleotidyl transferase AbiEii/AbiGii toxin family protein [Deltaproteobacteria bacterium]|nr:nucleotidyl transferase AbiEii/AbiGii toxin family protein [Deltaproteobacteria bacterium]